MMQGSRGGQYGSNQGRSRDTQGAMMQKGVQPGKRMMQGKPGAMSDDAQGAERQGMG